MSKPLDMTGWRMSEHNVPDSRITVLYKAGYSKNQSVAWHCRCDCGTEFDTLGKYLRNGTTKSCGCLRKEEAAKAMHKTRIDIKNKKFGLLTALYLTRKKGRYEYWHCKCECGNEIEAERYHLLSGHTKSCGCSRTSINETIIKNILIENNISFIKDKGYFNDLINNNGVKLRYDFIIFNNDTSIKRVCEFDGIQHIIPIKYFGGEERFYKQQEYDAIKNKYAWSHNIPIVRIPYTEKNITLETIMGDRYLVQPPQEFENGN